MVKKVRLPAHIKPIRYEIMLRPNLEEFTFFGEETAYLILEQPIKEIDFHANELEVESAKFFQNKKEIPIKNIKYNFETETVKFLFDKLVLKGKGELKLTFKGILNDKMHGFYRSKYTHEGQEKHLATTQFESTEARRAFPCIDEPAAKAIFDVTLMIPGSTTAISNTLPKTVSEHESGYKIVQFEPTPKMSTYLLAFIVGEFEFLEKQVEETLVRVFVTPGKKHQAQFALDFACKTLVFFNNYFDIKYPLPVLDLIAIPDFAAGAMENWGAITYRETALLIDPEHSASSNKQRVAIVIAHELAHQWFGNLVTMEWWTHLWLNEGFASYIEYLAVDHIFPEWDIWTQFLYQDQGIALQLDGLANTHPIEIEVHHPSEIDEIFDKVSYSKGASILRMLAQFLGPKDFRDGLRHYLKKHSYANASTDDLWKALEHISEKPVGKIMKNWTAKAGYPLLYLEEEKDSLKISQTRFYSSIHSAKSSTDTSVWQIPLEVKFNDAKAQTFLMDKNVIKIPKLNESWVKLNFQESSFLRVSYQEKYLHLLKKALENNELGTLDRLGLIRDVFDLAESGILSAVSGLELLEGFINEEDYTVWVEITSHLIAIEHLIFGEVFAEDFRQFSKKIYQKIGQKVGWEKKSDETHTQTLLRSLVLNRLGTYGEKQVLQKAKDIFDQREKRSIDPDIRATVYSLVAKSGGLKEFKKLVIMHNSESLQQERDRLMGALSSFKDSAILAKTLRFGISEDVRFQDGIFVISASAANPYGTNLTWEFIKNNWKLLKERYGKGHSYMPRLVECASDFNTTQRAKELEKFFQKNPTPQAARTIKQVIEKIYSNADFLKRDKDAIRKYLSSLSTS